MEPLPFAIMGFVALVVLDLAELRFGHDSRSGVREMPGLGDSGAGLMPRIRFDRGLRARPMHLACRSAAAAGAEWVAAPPLRGLLRLRPPASATGHVRLDLAALGK